MKTIPIYKYLRATQDLIYLADINFLICQKIYKSLPRDRTKANKFLLLSANNAFNETIGILHTLLFSIDKKELTIKPLLEKIINEEKSTSISIEDKKIDNFVKKISEDYPYKNYSLCTLLSNNDKRLIGDILRDIRSVKRQSGLNDLETIKKEFEQNKFHKIRHQSVAHKHKFLDNPGGAANLYLKDSYIDNLGAIIKKLRINSYFWFNYELINPHDKILDNLALFLGENISYD